MFEGGVDPEYDPIQCNGHAAVMALEGPTGRSAERGSGSRAKARGMGGGTPTDRRPGPPRGLQAPDIRCGSATAHLRVRGGGSGTPSLRPSGRARGPPPPDPSRRRRGEPGMPVVRRDCARREVACGAAVAAPHGVRRPTLRRRPDGPSWGPCRNGGAVAGLGAFRRAEARSETPATLAVRRGFFVGYPDNYVE
jgi:hypothetical protein